MHTTLRTMHGTNADHVAAVRATMQTLGAPTLRVVDGGDHYQALEGNHRLAACAALGLAPTLIILAPDAVVDADSLDWMSLEDGAQYTAGALAAEAAAWWDTGAYTIEDDGSVTAQ